MDEALAARVHGFMRNQEKARVFSARQYNASQMTVLLRGLDLLVTSRFHAAVLSLAGGVPQVAVGHDTRLATLYQDLGLKERWFIDPRVQDGLARGTLVPEFMGRLRERVDKLLAEPGRQKDLLRRGHAEHLARARQNRRLLAEFAARNLAAAKTGDAAAVKAYASPAAGTEGGTEWVA